MKDKNLQEDIFLANADSIYRFVYLRTRSKEKAEDITAETFKRMLEKEDLKPEIAKYWLFTVARNLMYDMFKKDSNKQVIDDLVEESELNIDDQGDYDEDLINEELLNKLDEYIDQISPKSKEVISLKIWENLKFNEIADLLSEKESTVKLRYYRGLEKLQELVARDYDTKKITIPLLVGGFALLGAEPVYAAPPAFISNFISTHISIMANTMSGGAAAQTSGAGASSAAGTTGASTASAAGSAAKSAGLLGLLKANSVLVTSAATAVIIGGAAVAAIASGVFTGTNTATPNSYPNSYGVSYPTSYQEIVTPPDIEEDPNTNTITFTSKSDQYDMDSAKFTADVPNDWVINEKLTSNNNAYQVSFSKAGYKFTIQQQKVWADTLGCVFNGNRDAEMGSHVMYFLKQTFVNSSKNDLIFAVAKSEDVRGIDWIIGNGYAPTQFSSKTYYVCDTTNKVTGGDRTDFGIIKVETNGYNSTRDKEMLNILKSLNYAPVASSSSSSSVSAVQFGPYTKLASAPNVVSIGSGKQRFTSRNYTSAFNSIVKSQFSIEIPNDWYVQEYVSKDLNTDKVVGYEVQIFIDDENTVLKFLTEAGLQNSNIACQDNSIPGGEDPQIDDKTIHSSKWKSVNTQDNVNLKYAVASDTSFYDYGIEMTDKQRSYTAKGPNYLQTMVCEFNGVNGSLLSDYGFIHVYSSLTGYIDQLAAPLASLKKV